MNFIGIFSIWILYNDNHKFSRTIEKIKINKIENNSFKYKNKNIQIPEELKDSIKIGSYVVVTDIKHMSYPTRYLGIPFYYYETHEYNIIKAEYNAIE